MNYLAPEGKPRSARALIKLCRREIRVDHRLDAAARGALDEALLEQERLDHVFHRIARFGDGVGAGTGEHRNA